MEPEYFGIEEFTEEDWGYGGSRFRDVRDAVFANPYQKVWGGEGESPPPYYKATLSGALRGVFSRRYLLRKAAERTVDSHSDLRWGPDRRGFRRLIHPNGVCLTGLWEITEETEYSGYFRKGSQALVVGRYSSNVVVRGQTRSLALVGKLFPTTDPDHAELLRTANFFTQEDLGGDHTEYINDAELRNAPDVTPWPRGKSIPLLLISVITLVVFTLVDKKAILRQLYQIAELGKPRDELTRAPMFMRLIVAADQPRIEGQALDLRDEVMAQIFDKGDAAPKRKLTFHIEVTDEGTMRNFLGHVRRSFKNWRRIGQLTFDDAVASYNGDFVIHFNHPGWRDDRNDPATAARPAIS
ncbi:hypothetical protein RZS28_10690 [Methylocapsa polymorpha]|uniref:Uncharacterized protein n=1 Tax=Methylocapsa polymorpha TaxID=3080828 RepID=A0ABZ0HPH0_9HYPH|nr:hypothetical protein RZS28_10690 [Methylocapsa sp. RX1]